MLGLKIEDPARLVSFIVVFIGCVVLVALDKLPIEKLQYFALWLLPSPVGTKKGEGPLDGPQ